MKTILSVAAALALLAGGTAWAQTSTTSPNAGTTSSQTLPQTPPGASSGTTMPPGSTGPQAPGSRATGATAGQAGGGAGTGAGGAGAAGAGGAGAGGAGGAGAAGAGGR
jgi:hypothetical protein